MRVSLPRSGHRRDSLADLHVLRHRRGLVRGVAGATGDVHGSFITGCTTHVHVFDRMQGLAPPPFVCLVLFCLFVAIGSFLCLFVFFVFWGGFCFVLFCLRFVCFTPAWHLGQWDCPVRGFSWCVPVASSGQGWPCTLLLSRRDAWSGTFGASVVVWLSCYYHARPALFGQYRSRFFCAVQRTIPLSRMMGSFSFFGLFNLLVVIMTFIKIAIMTFIIKKTSLFLHFFNILFPIYLTFFF